ESLVQVKEDVGRRHFESGLTLPQRRRRGLDICPSSEVEQVKARGRLGGPELGVGGIVVVGVGKGEFGKDPIIASVILSLARFLGKQGGLQIGVVHGRPAYAVLPGQRFGRGWGV